MEMAWGIVDSSIYSAKGSGVKVIGEMVTAV
jgi:hypothetical protein